MNIRALVVFAMLAFVVSASFSVAGGVHQSNSQRYGVGYAAHTPIRINNNTDFTAANGVVAGNGSESSPYVISGWDIDAHGAGVAIYIGNTTAYFVVRDSVVYNTTYHGEYDDGVGIELYNVSNGIVENNTCHDNYMEGIYIYLSANNTVEDNTCDNNGIGIALYKSEHNIIKNNTCANEDWYGIYIGFSGWNTLYSNALIKAGITLYGSEITFATQTIPENNTVNEKPVIYLTGNQNNATINSGALGELILGNASWLAVANITIFNGSDAIIIGYSSHLFIHDGNFSNNSGDGLFMMNSTSIVIENSSFNGNNEGMCMYFSRNITIKDNVLRSNALGMDLDGISYSKIVNNTCENSDDDGIAMFYSDNNTIADNVLNGNEWDAIEMDSSSNNTIQNNVGNHSLVNGLGMSASNNNRILNNIWGHNEKGVFMNASCGNILMGNLVANNGDGVYLDADSRENLIYNNSFYYNHNSGDRFSISTIQAYDASGANFWNTSTEGNYWLDWANNNDTNDKNNDGIVDWPYALGGGKVKDYYPLKNATRLLMPTAPTNLHAYVTSSYVNLTWAAPAYPGTPPLLNYKIYRNGTLIATVPASQLWYKDTGVSSGQNYSYYITAVNAAGESQNSTVVQITVPEPVPEFGGWNFILLFAVFFAVYMRKK